MFTDTHCHLNMMVEKKFDEPLQKHHFPLIKTIIEQAAEQQVTRIINVGTSLAESLNSIAIAKQFKEVYATVGIHPCDAGDTWKEELKQLKQLLKEKELHKIVGVGETGLDFYHKPFNAERQRDCFKAHIELALEHNLGLVIHVRDAGEEALRVLEEYARDITKATIHCFAQNQSFADIVTSWGFFIGIDGPITYPKNEQLREVVRNVSLDHLVLETDAPFLPPQAFRGKKNYPAYIPLFAELIAELKKVSLEQLAQATTHNAQTLFGLED